MKAAVYCRVSTDEQAEKGTSLATQEERCRAHVKAQGWKLVDVFIDAGESGTKGSRPALDRLMAACRRGEIEAVVVTKLDRFGRSNRHLANALGDLDELGVRFVSLSEQFDTSTPMGKGMLAISGVFAEIEHATIRERMTTGRRAVVSQGYWGGGVLPYGFRAVQDGSHKRLEVDEAEAETVRLVAALLVDEGKSATAVATHLNAIGNVPRRAARWTGALIRHALSRESLAPDLLEQERFDRVQEALASRTTLRNRENDRVYPLSLRLFGHCGEPYAGTYRKELGRRYYMCRNKNYENRATRCDDRAIRADDIEVVVWEQVCDLLSKPQRLLDLAEQYLGFRSSQLEVERESIEDTERKLRETERGIKNVLLTSAKAGLEPKEIEEAVAELTRERDVLRRRLAMVEAWQVDSARESERMRRLWALADQAHRRLPEMTPEEQKEVLDLLDVRVTIIDHATAKTPARVRIEGIVSDALMDERDLETTSSRRSSPRGRAAAAAPPGSRARR